MLPTTRPHVCLQCHMSFAPVLPHILQHFCDLLINKCFNDAENLVNSKPASRDIPAAQGSNKFSGLWRRNDSGRG